MEKIENKGLVFYGKVEFKEEIKIFWFHMAHLKLRR